MKSDRPKPRLTMNPRTWLRALLQLDDTDHSIALGTAIGMAIGLTPTVGIQMILVAVISLLTRKLFRFNIMAALITVYVSNPLTMIPIYWMLYVVGTWFVEGDVTREQFAAIFEYEGFAEWWETIAEIFIGIGKPLLIGTAIVASLGGLMTYPLMRGILRWLKGPEGSRRTLFDVITSDSATSSPSPSVPASKSDTTRTDSPTDPST
jgi:uncharacterized protein